MSDLQPGSKRTHRHGQDLADIYRTATRSWASFVWLKYSVCNIKGTAWSQAINMYIPCKVSRDRQVCIVYRTQ